MRPQISESSSFIKREKQDSLDRTSEEVPDPTARRRPRRGFERFPHHLDLDVPALELIILPTLLERREMQSILLGDFSEDTRDMLLSALDRFGEIDPEIDFGGDEFGEGIDFDTAVDDVDGGCGADHGAVVPGFCCEGLGELGPG